MKTKLVIQDGVQEIILTPENDYEKGIFSWRDIKVEKQQNGEWKGSISDAENGKPNTVGVVTWRFLGR